MRPVNLTPKAEQQRLQTGSGKAPYLILGVLGLLVIASFLYVTFSNQTADKKAELSKLEEELSATQAQLQETGGGNSFISLAQQRQSALNTLGIARFDWSRALGQIAKAMPSNAWLLSVTGKVAKDSSTGENTSSGNQNGEQPPEVVGPSLQLVGCSFKQSDVARMASRLRTVDRVEKVLVTSSNEKDDAAGAAGLGNATGNADDNECRTKLGIHKFNVTVAFQPGLETVLITQLKSAATAATATPPPAATQTSTTASTTGSTPTTGSPPPTPTPAPAPPSTGQPVSAGGTQ